MEYKQIKKRKLPEVGNRQKFDSDRIYNFDTSKG